MVLTSTYQILLYLPFQMSSSSSVYRRLHGIFTNTQKITIKPKPTNPKTTPSKPINQEHQNIINNFKKSCESAKFRRYETNYIAAIRQLNDNVTAIHHILDHQKQYPEIQNELFVSRLILLYGKANMFEHARELFDEMPQLKCHRTVYAFNALLESCIRAEEFDVMRELFRVLPEELSIERDVVSYNTLIKGYCKAGLMDSAVDVIDEMERKGIQPDKVTLNTLLNAYCVSKRFSEAEDLWVSMEKRNDIADSVSYHVRLRCLVANNQLKEAIELFDEMGKKDIIPLSLSYNMMIKISVDDGNLEEAKKWYEKMVENGRYPDHETFKMLINFACDKGNLDFALELCKKAMDSKISVYSPTMQRVVDGLAENSKLEDAKELVILAKSYKRYGYKLSLPF